MTYVYSSRFAGDIVHFIEQKHSLGFDYVSSEEILFEFDKFCAVRFPAEENLTREICFAWAVRRNSEGNRRFLNRLSPIRELARYIISIGKEAFVLPFCFAKKGQRHTPYIYSERELNALFEAADKIVVEKNNTVRHIVVGTMIRLIYCCGLRPGEARRLRFGNVDLSNGRIEIIESKGHKDRFVYIDGEVLELMQMYNMRISEIVPEREWFFPMRTDTKCSSAWLMRNFAELCKSVRIKPDEFCLSVYRVYNLRHTFATHRIYKWLGEGKDINAMLPYLSAYMGHSELSDTCYYIHLIPKLLAEMSGVKYDAFESMLPEVRCCE